MVKKKKLSMWLVVVLGIVIIGAFWFLIPPQGNIIDLDELIRTGGIRTYRFGIGDIGNAGSEIENPNNQLVLRGSHEIVDSRVVVRCSQYMGNYKTLPLESEKSFLYTIIKPGCGVAATWTSGGVTTIQTHCQKEAIFTDCPEDATITFEYEFNIS